MHNAIKVTSLAQDIIQNAKDRMSWITLICERHKAKS